MDEREGEEQEEYFSLENLHLTGIIITTTRATN